MNALKFVSFNLANQVVRNTNAQINPFQALPATKLTIMLSQIPVRPDFRCWFNVGPADLVDCVEGGATKILSPEN